MKPEPPGSPHGGGSGVASVERMRPGGAVGEMRLGQTREGLLANAALVALARAARSVPLYQPRSTSVRQLVEEYHARMSEALAVGDIDVEVRPLELVRGNEVVLLDRSRERSLPFLLFRDGVRRLTISATASWDEQVRLLELLVRRAATARASEDDVVTMFWKGSFLDIKISAIDGFVEDDEEAGELVSTEQGDDDGPSREQAPAEEGNKGPSGDRFGRTEVPRDWDLPIPDFVEGGELVWRPVTPESLQLLRDELAPEGLPTLALRTVGELLEVASDVKDPTTHEDLLPILAEVRDYLLATGDFGPNSLFWRLLRDMPPAGREVGDKVLRACNNERPTRLLLEWARRRTVDLPRPAAVRAELERLPGDQLGFLLSHLGSTDDPGTRAAGLYLLRAWVRDESEQLLMWLEGMPEAIILDLLPELIRARRSDQLEIVARFATHASDAVVNLLIRGLDEAEVGSVDTPQLFALLKLGRPAMRVRVCQLLAATGDTNAAAPLMDRLRQSASLDVGPEEAMALGAAIGRLSGARWADEAARWVRPPGLWQRFFGGLAAHRIPLHGAVTLLTAVDANAHAPAIRWMAKRADPALREAALRRLAQDRRDG